MKFLTAEQATELLKKADTPELIKSLIDTLIEALRNYEARPDLSQDLATVKSLLALSEQERDNAFKTAEEALEKLNAFLEKTPQDVTVTVEKKKYKVLFGVDGLSKEDLAKDKSKIARLIKIGSGALEILEDK